MTKQDWIDVARLCLTSRYMDDIEEQELAPSGKVTYQFSAKGHELIQVLLGQKLRQGHDAATVYYRSRPFVLTAGMTIEEGFAGPLARSGSRNGGRDIGVVHNLPNRLGVTVLPTSGDVGAQYTPAVGWAQAITYRSSVLQEKDWDSAIAVALAGDGSVATNGFWSALTIATTIQLPYLFFIEDNGFGISVPGTFQTPGANIAENLASFKGLTIFQGSGSDPAEAEERIAEAVNYVRTQRKPALLRLQVPRLCGHSGADNQAYKSPEQVADEQARDPLTHLQKFLSKKKILTEKQFEELRKEVLAEVRGAAERALAQPEPSTEGILAYTFSEPSKTQKVGGMRAEGLLHPAGDTTPNPPESRRVNLIEAVKRTLEAEMKANPRLMVFGEDVGVKGGVHGATVGLQAQFGAERVFDTSLSEEGIIGRSIGLAYAGLVPVPEIQFRKYLDPAMEQLNDTGTIRWRTNGDFAAPYVVRIPVGCGKRTGDPWHSVSGEAIFAHTIGWKVAFPSNARVAAGLLRSALRGDDPVIFLEHRALLDTLPGRSPYPGDNYIYPFGQAEIVRTGSKATIVTWGEMVSRSLEAVANAGIDAEVIDLCTIVPWDKETVLTSLRKTNRCLIIHEDTLTAGFGAEIAACIAQEAFRFLDAPVERLAVPDCPIPYNPLLTAAVLPSVEGIAATLKKLVDF